MAIRHGGLDVWSFNAMSILSAIGNTPLIEHANLNNKKARCKDVW